MAYDFPASPTQGQQFSPSAGVSYVYNGYAWDLLSGPASAVTPTKVTVLTSGSGTYNVTAGTTILMVEMVGGGCGGYSASAPTAGGNTTFGSLTANGAVDWQGASATGGDVNLRGGDGSQAGNLGDNVNLASGSDGGISYFGGNGIGQYGGVVGTNAGANTGSGGGGGGRNVTGSALGGRGGGAGGYLRKVIAAPASSYAYAVGAGGTGGPTGASTFSGGNGGSGIIIVTEYGGSSAALPGSKVLIQTQTVSAVAQVDFVTGIDATYDEYELRFINVVLAVAGSVGIRVSTDGGASFDSASNYQYGGRIVYFSGTGSGDVNTAATTAIFIILAQQTAVATSMDALVTFFQPASSSRRKNFMASGEGNNATSGQGWFAQAGSWYGSNAAINALRIFNSNGNISGTFNLYGIKK